MSVPRVFIGSSTEGKDVAERLAARLDSNGSIETKVWTQSVFDVGGHVLDALILQASTVDFAVLVLRPDDFVESRDARSQAPRDNVVFELGLFIGALGKNRTYMVQPDGVDLKLPSDLAGRSRTFSRHILTNFGHCSHRPDIRCEGWHVVLLAGKEHARERE